MDIDIIEEEKTPSKKPLVALIGPTAVGKTALSLQLAAALHAEVVSVDSRQVYRYMDVGTDKVSREIRRKTLHHLIDVVDPDEVFTAADFVARAQDCVRRIAARGRVPLFVGGTPFYYQALFGGLLSIDVPTNDELRQNLMKLPPEELHTRLQAVDRASAARLYPNDRFRVSRALEIYLTTGHPMSELVMKGRSESPFDVLYIGLFRPRDQIVENIEKRLKLEFDGGFAEEVRWLLEQGYSPELPSLMGLSYREMVRYCLGRISRDEALNRAVIATRQFAKRQMTWFRKFQPVLWYDLSVETSESVGRKVLEAAERHLEGENVK